MIAERITGIEERRSIDVEHSANDDFRAPIPGSGWHDMVVAAGGASILVDIGVAEEPVVRDNVHDVQLAAEFVRKADPEVVVRLDRRSRRLASGDEHFVALINRAGSSGLKAIKNGECCPIACFAAGTASKRVRSLFMA